MSGVEKLFFQEHSFYKVVYFVNLLIEMKDQFTREDSLRVINKMIAQAKRRPSAADGIHTLIWGYLVLVAALLHWRILMTMQSDKAPFVWLLMLVGLAMSAIVGRKTKKTSKVKTYVDASIRQLWIGAGIVFALLFFGVQPDASLFLPLMIALYGFAMWVQGALLKYRPYQAGAIASWLCSGVAFLLPTEHQLLALAGSVLLGYIVPGHLLYHKTSGDHV